TPRSTGRFLADGPGPRGADADPRARRDPEPERLGERGRGAARHPDDPLGHLPPDPGLRPGRAAPGLAGHHRAAVVRPRRSAAPARRPRHQGDDARLTRHSAGEEPTMAELTAEALPRRVARYQLETGLGRLTPAESAARGKAARAAVPRTSHAVFDPGPDRPD